MSRSDPNLLAITVPRALINSRGCVIGPYVGSPTGVSHRPRADIMLAADKALANSVGGLAIGGADVELLVPQAFANLGEPAHLDHMMFLGASSTSCSTSGSNVRTPGYTHSVSEWSRRIRCLG